MTLRLSLAFLLLLSLLAAAAGAYSGTWASSENNAEGSIAIRLAEPPEVSFTLGGESVKTKVLSSKQEAGGSFQIAYEFELQGTRLISTLNGTAAGEKVEGRYTTKTAEGGTPVDAGTFKAAAAK